MSLFTDAATVLLGDLQAVAGVAATYSRGATTLAITIVPARTRQESFDNEGTSMYKTNKDFLILKSDITSLFPPRSGDGITIAGGESYKVAPLGNGTTTYEQTNDEAGNGAILRIHVVRKTL